MDNEELIMYLDGLPTDTFVLHGSRVASELLCPALPVQPDLMEEYNLCAVYGTLYTDIALLYAVIHEDNKNWGWKVYPERIPSLCVYGPDSLKGGTGYIHILKRKDFTRIIDPGLICLAFEPIQPVEIIQVEPIILELLQKRKRIQCY